jgi:predicted transcriptional regulator
MTPTVLVAAASVTVVLMLGIFTLGQWIGSGQEVGPTLALSREDNERLIQIVQETEAAHVTALAELVRMSALASPPVRTRNRRVALHSFYAVADQMVTLAPDDPLTARIMQAFDQTNRGPFKGDDSGRSQIVWF